MELTTTTILWLILAVITALHTLWTFAAAVARDRLPPFLSRDPKQSAPWIWGGVLLAAGAHALYLVITL